MSKNTKAATTKTTTVNKVEKAAAQAAEAVIEGAAFRANQTKGGKKTAAPVAKKEPTPREVNRDPNKLSKPQLRVIAALAKSKEGLTRKEIAEQSETDYASLNSVIGCNNPELLATDHFAPSLLRRGLVKFTPVEGRGNVFTLTAAGKKAAGK